MKKNILFANLLLEYHPGFSALYIFSIHRLHELYILLSIVMEFEQPCCYNVSFPERLVNVKRRKKRHTYYSWSPHKCQLYFHYYIISLKYNMLTYDLWFTQKPLHSTKFFQNVLWKKKIKISNYRWFCNFIINLLNIFQNFIKFSVY